MCFHAHRHAVMCALRNMLFVYSLHSQLIFPLRVFPTALCRLWSTCIKKELRKLRVIIPEAKSILREDRREGIPLHAYGDLKSLTEGMKSLPFGACICTAIVSVVLINTSRLSTFAAILFMCCMLRPCLICANRANKRGQGRDALPH